MFDCVFVKKNDGSVHGYDRLLKVIKCVKVDKRATYKLLNWVTSTEPGTPEVVWTAVNY